jgi:hypothetical protein
MFSLVCYCVVTHRVTSLSRCSLRSAHALLVVTLITNQCHCVLLCCHSQGDIISRCSLRSVLALLVLRLITNQCHLCVTV